MAGGITSKRTAVRMIVQLCVNMTQKSFFHIIIPVAHQKRIMAIKLIASPQQHHMIFTIVIYIELQTINLDLLSTYIVM